MKYLECYNCKCQFQATDSQWKHRIVRPNQYCSDICRAAQRQLRRKVHPERGPCKTCQAMFHSRYPKPFCSLKCYNKSPEFLEMVKSNLVKAAITNSNKPRNIAIGHCLECNGEIVDEPAIVKKRKFCSHHHFRLYMNKRFDRAIASGEKIAEINNYDEFMTLDELPCFIEGCSWSGHHLGLHINLKHGIKAIEAKRAAGFNLSTGLISNDLQDTLRARDNHRKDFQFNLEAIRCSTKPFEKYKSREGKEHASKGRMVALENYSGHIHNCINCKKEFKQYTPFGKTLYCSRSCRDLYYLNGKVQRKFPMICINCDKTFMGNYTQNLRRSKGLETVCSLNCRNIYNAQKRRGAIHEKAEVKQEGS